MERPDTIIRRAVNARQISPAMRLQVERLGIQGVRALKAELLDGSLSEEAKIRALRLMALITREQYPRGKLDLIQSASRLMEEQTEAVRTAATDLILSSLGAIIRIRQCEDLRKEAEDLARCALTTALEQGVRTDVAERAAAWLRGSP